MYDQVQLQEMIAFAHLCSTGLKGVSLQLSQCAVSYTQFHTPKRTISYTKFHTDHAITMSSSYGPEAPQLASCINYMQVASALPVCWKAMLSPHRDLHQGMVMATSMDTAGALNL